MFVANATAFLPAHVGPIFSPYILDTLTHPEEYWYAVSMEPSAAQWFFEMHCSLRTIVSLDSSNHWCWNGQRDEGDLPQFDAPREANDLRHLVYYCSGDKSLHVHHLVFDGVSVCFLSEQADTRHIADSDVALRADYLLHRQPEMLRTVHEVVSARLFDEGAIAANLACNAYESISLDAPPSLNHLIGKQSKDLGVPLADAFYALLVVLTLQAAGRASGPFLLIDNCRDPTNSSIFGMVVREFGCVFEYRKTESFQANIRHVARRMTNLPQAYRRMFSEFACAPPPRGSNRAGSHTAEIDCNFQCPLQS
eukprot:5364037-Prymnesium_polylepis.3